MRVWLLNTEREVMGLSSMKLFNLNRLDTSFWNDLHVSERKEGMFSVGDTFFRSFFSLFLKAIVIQKQKLLNSTRTWPK